VEELEDMIKIIDSEIVSLGDKISPEKLDYLTRQKDKWAKEIAELKGEKINRKGLTSFS